MFNLHLTTQIHMQIPITY